ncbi:flagellar biosynthesis protein FlhF [Arhodomonas sp. AD133]|uniref:flagellar biosynthesis protein FlhF n=1 Tax=Arhodomonas sp. AD133 TaxID=3415009 RepID=UPI003EBB7543
MKIKRVFAEDMRQAMRQVRDVHGPDAVILSSRRVEGGVEVISAVDYDEKAVREAVAEAERGVSPTPASFSDTLARAERESTAPAARTDRPRLSVTVGDDDEPPPADGNPTADDVSPAPLDLEYERADAPASTPDPAAGEQAPRRASADRIQWTPEPAMQAMREELSNLRTLFENQLTLMEWQQMGRAKPVRAALLRRLHAMGLAADVCRGLADAVGAEEDLEQAWGQAMKLVRRHLPTADDEIVDQGGVVAVVGPTGVGKTTTVAKLAARAALRHGRHQVALVTTDNFRVGGQEQLRSFARILGVPVHAAADGEELTALLADLADRRLVLVDTAGMSQRDMRLAEQFRTLAAGERQVRPYLVLSANTQLSALIETLRAFRAVAPVGCILSKTDEATSLGGAITAVMRSRLPVAYVAHGQRVPEDLRPARAEALLEEAEALAERYKAATEDDESLAVAFAGTAARRG